MFYNFKLELTANAAPLTREKIKRVSGSPRESWRMSFVTRLRGAYSSAGVARIYSAYAQTSSGVEHLLKTYTEYSAYAYPVKIFDKF